MILSLQVYPLQQAFPASSMCLHSIKQLARSLLSRKRVFRGFQYKSESYYSLFKHGFTIHGYYSRFLFCLFKEAWSSFVNTFNLGSYALPSLFFLSHHVTLSSFQSFLQAFLPLSIIRYFSLCII